MSSGGDYLVIGYAPPSGLGLVDQRDRDVFGELIPDGRVGTWSQTASGEIVWTLDPRPDEVRIEDAARGLANECRYGRQLKRRGLWYAVAEHCCIVSDYVARAYGPAFALEALLHDIGEAWGFGDVPRPLKHDPRVRPLVDEIEDRWVTAAYARFGVISTPESRAAIKAIDDLIVVDEIFAVIRRPEIYFDRHPPQRRLHAKIQCLQPAVAEVAWLSRLAALHPPSADEVARLLAE